MGVDVGAIVAHEIFNRNGHADRGTPTHAGCAADQDVFRLAHVLCNDKLVGRCKVLVDFELAHVERLEKQIGSAIRLVVIVGFHTIDTQHGANVVFAQQFTTGGGLGATDK